MRVSISNTINLPGMSDNHPLKTGYQDKTNDELLDKILISIGGFTTTFCISLLFGIFNCLLIVSVISLAYYLITYKKSSLKSKEVQIYQDLDDADELADMESLSAIDPKEYEENKRFHNLHDQTESTEYTLFSL